MFSDTLVIRRGRSYGTGTGGATSWQRPGRPRTATSSPSRAMSGAATPAQLADFHKAVTSAEGAPDISHAIREFLRLWR